MIEGIYGIYKPKGPTSNGFLNKLRKISGIRKIGHAGTLDPLASGILVVGIGRPGTKKLGEAVKKEKEYLAKIKLGFYSTTDDEEGEKTAVEFSKNPRRWRGKPELKDIHLVIKKFIGKIRQTPPIFSAIKIAGKEAYKLARKGQEVKMKSRPAFIKKITLLKYKWPFLELRVVTGPGVYIRSLARDLGEKLKTGGYLAGLERTRVGQFKKEKALTLAGFARMIKKTSL